MPYYRHSDLKREYIGKIKEKPEDIEMTKKFIEHYGLTSKSDGKKPTSTSVYQWYKKKTGHLISKWYDDAAGIKKEDVKKSQDPIIHPEQPPVVPEVQNPPPAEIPSIHTQPVSNPPEPPKAQNDTVVPPEIPVDEEFSGIEGNEKEISETDMTIVPSSENRKSILAAGTEKIKIELGKVGTVVADFEAWIYSRWNLRPLNENERVETAESIQTVLDKRIKLYSQNGDIFNVIIVISSHAGSRILENKLGTQKQHDNRNRDNTEEYTYEGRDPTAPMIAGKDF